MNTNKEKSSYDRIKEELEALSEEPEHELEVDRDFTFENTEFLRDELANDSNY